MHISTTANCQLLITGLLARLANKEDCYAVDQLRPHLEISEAIPIFNEASRPCSKMEKENEVSLPLIEYAILDYFR